jgi:hypothetical protein
MKMQKQEITGDTFLIFSAFLSSRTFIFTIGGTGEQLSQSLNIEIEYKSESIKN